MKRFDFKNDPRINWLVNTLEELDPAKILLICRTREKVLALEKALAAKVRVKVGVFHEQLSLVQRDRNAAWFAEKDGARILICSEIGSEGRNFQFVHHLVLFDLPLHPELLVQRIGRLDRIGQKEDIQILVPFIKPTPQESLVRWFHEGLNAFEVNLENGDGFLAAFKTELKEVFSNASKGASSEKLNHLIKKTRKHKAELVEKLAGGRDRLMEMNSFRPRVAEELIENVVREDQDESLEYYLELVFDYYNVDMEHLAHRTFYLRTSHKSAEIFPSIPADGISITFDRKKALSREDISFLTWDHPIVREAIDAIISLGTGAASFGVIPGAGSQALLLEAVFVLEIVGGQGLYIDRFLPNTPIRVVVDHSGNDVTEVLPSSGLDEILVSGSAEDLLNNETFTEVLFPKMVEEATSLAEVLSIGIKTEGLEKTRNTLDHEISRLVNLQKQNGHIRKDEVEYALAEKNRIQEFIESSQLRLDAVRLIQKG